jgi:hypothetical protein
MLILYKNISIKIILINRKYKQIINFTIKYKISTEIDNFVNCNKFEVAIPLINFSITRNQN